MFCRNCGEAIGHTDNFCRHCATKIEKNETRESPRISTPPPEDQDDQVVWLAKTSEARQYEKKGDNFRDEEENYEEALEYYNKALELEPTNGKLLGIGKADLLNNLENYEEALACINKALELEPALADEVHLLLKKFDAHYGMENREEASACINKALELDPDNPEVQGIKLAFDLLLNVIEKKQTKKTRSEKEITGERKKAQEYNLYEILGVSSNTSQEEIQSRFRELSLKLHPDKETSALSQQTMKQIIEAYNTLKDPKKRKEYDDTL